MAVKAIKTRKGFVIIVVLAMIIMLGIILFSFNHKALAGINDAQAARISGQALNCARAGLNIAIACLQAGTNAFVDDKTANLLNGAQSINVCEGKCWINLSPENARINVNSLKDKNGNLDRKRIDQILRLIDILNREDNSDYTIGYGLVPCLIDWTDDDEQITCLPFIQHENLGAESDYYVEQDPAYKSANSRLETLEELLLVKNITPGLFARLGNLVTVNSNGKININHADRFVIESLCPGLDKILAQIIIARRETKPFEAVADLRDIPGMTEEIFNQIRESVTVEENSEYYRIETRGVVADTSCTISAILRRNTDTKTIDVIQYREMEPSVY